MDDPGAVAARQAGSAREEAPSFEAFFERERPRLFRALLVLTHNAHEADELLQDAFCKVWERWDVVGAMADPTGYLYRTAMNAYRSGARRAVRAGRLAVHLAPASDPFEEVATRDEAYRALGRLTRRRRSAIVLVDLLGFDSEEAGRILGIRAGTVRRLVSQARATLAAGGRDA
jgi:RNA polymerase sigma factor (sigma-70 family)